MPEQKSAFSREPSWRIQANDLRGKLQQNPSLETAVNSLSLWFDVLRRPPYDEKNADERLGATFASDTDHPVNWCARESVYLPPELERSLSTSKGANAPIEILDPLIRYIFGRACMKSMMARPPGTSGLSLAYDLLWPMGHDGIAPAGADDELLNQLSVAREARIEIEAEARRLRKNPVSAARMFDRDRTALAIQQASTPVSLEACTHWSIRGMVIALSFGRVVQVIVSSDTPFAAELLETIRNPALVASIVRGSGILAIPAKANLLRFVNPTFDPTDRWTGKTTAWMILLEIEESLSELLRKQFQEVRSGAPRPTDPEAIINHEVDVTTEALLSRPDGSRLALEWLAHLLWTVLLLRTPVAKAGEKDLDPQPVLLKALGTRLGRQDWANPLRVWAMFGGSSLVADIDDSHRLAKGVPLLLPLWHDWLGQRNTLVPIAVAVHLWDDTVAPPGWLAEWVRYLCRDLEGLSAVDKLAEAEPSQAARYLAWPLMRSDRPSERFGELWSDARWQLTRARFSKLENAADAVRPCVALIRIGLRMLEWSAYASTDDAGALASLLADAVDEVRYTLPEIGIAQWSSLAGSLAGVMAAIGLLKDDGCGRLLARYEGDDDSLAAAAVNAAANGVPIPEVRKALASIGMDAGELVERWAVWNARFARDESGKPGKFLAQLLAISQAGTDIPS